jgi:hypothetical protein
LRNDSIGDELRRVSTPEIRRLAKQRNIDIEGPEVRYVRAGARELVDRNNYLASDPLRVPVEPRRNAGQRWAYPFSARDVPHQETCEKELTFEE